jgi:hypothetical protein
MASNWAFVLAVTFVLVGGQPPAAGAQPASAPAATASAPTLSRAEMEAFLQNAKIVKRTGVSKGITATVRVTLSDGTLTHDASVQAIDERKVQFQTAQGMELNFRDAWQFNVAAYILDKLLDLRMIPATVARRIDGRNASFTWWIDNVLMDESARLKKKLEAPDNRRWNDQMFIVRLFDNLIYNTDRNLGNLVIDTDWRIWMIDHTRAFRRQRSLRTPGDLTRGARGVLAKLRELDRSTLDAALRDYLEGVEIDALLARRDLIVARFEKSGQDALYDAPRWPWP